MDVVLPQRSGNGASGWTCADDEYIARFPEVLVPSPPSQLAPEQKASYARPESGYCGQRLHIIPCCDQDQCHRKECGSCKHRELFGGGRSSIVVETLTEGEEDHQHGISGHHQRGQTPGGKEHRRKETGR